MSLEYSGYLWLYTNTPPPRFHMVQPDVSGKENGRWTKRPKGSLGKGYKRRTMHHVTINQKLKRDDKKKNNFSQENCLPKN
jgi:hypothetical protein